MGWGRSGAGEEGTRGRRWSGNLLKPTQHWGPGGGWCLVACGKHLDPALLDFKVPARWVWSNMRSLGCFSAKLFLVVYPDFSRFLSVRALIPS
jgi:hypothetical protein